MKRGIDMGDFDFFAVWSLTITIYFPGGTSEAT